MISNMLLTDNTKSQKASRSLDLCVKTSTSNLERLGSVIVRQNRAKIYWGEGKWDEKEKSNVEGTESHATSENDDEDMPYTFRRFLNRENEPLTGCATTVKEIKKLRDSEDSETILVSGMDDNEWWTMVIPRSTRERERERLHK